MQLNFAESFIPLFFHFDLSSFLPMFVTSAANCRTWLILLKKSLISADLFEVSV
jgi:hypothetical protein